MSEALHAPRPERAEVLNDDGSPAGIVRDLSEIHKREERHPDVHVAIINEDSVLLQRRAAGKKLWPGMLDILGGHRPVGETSVGTAQREVSEEYGLQEPAESFQFVGAIGEDLQGAGGKIHRTHGEYYVVNKPGLEISQLTLPADEVAEALWVPIDQLAADLAHPQAAERYVPHDPEVWQLCLDGIRAVAEANR